MRRTLRRLTLFSALASISFGSVAQSPPRHDKYGKVVKLTATEIDLEITENDQPKVEVYVKAGYAKFDPINVGEMAKVHFYTDEKGVDIAETLTASSENKPGAVPNPLDAPDPAAIASGENQPAAPPNSTNAPDKTAIASGGDSGSSPWAHLGRRPRIAILDFDYATVQTSSSAIFGTNVDVGKGVTDLLVNDLAKDGTYSIIKRTALSKIMAEQNFSNSERADPASAAKIGKLLGVDAVIIGSITQFGNDPKKTNLGGGGGSWGGFGIGGTGHSNSKVKVDVTVRLVDVDTGWIVASAEGAGQSARLSTALGGGGGTHGAGGGNVDFGSSDFQTTIIGEATKQAVDKMSTEIIADAHKLQPWAVVIEGLVVDVDGGQININVGSKAGVKVGDRFEILRVSEEIKDPATGAVLHQLTNSIGVIKATDVDDAAAVCSPVSGSGFQVGDRVKLVKK